MFESVSQNDELELNGVNISFFAGLIALIFASFAYDTTFTEWLIQAYILTFMVFINYPRWYGTRHLRELWFWKAMTLTAVVLHPAILAGMWFLDGATKPKWGAGRRILAVCVVACLLEFAILSKIFELFRPSNRAHGASGTAS